MVTLQQREVSTIPKRKLNESHEVCIHRQGFIILRGKLAGPGYVVLGGGGSG